MLLASVPDLENNQKGSRFRTEAVLAWYIGNGDFVNVCAMLLKVGFKFSWM